MPRLRCPNAPTPASLFVQLSMRRPATATALPSSSGLRTLLLDFLLPLPLAAAPAPRTTPGAFSILRAHHHHHRAISTAAAATTFPAAAQARHSTSPWRRPTTTTSRSHHPPATYAPPPVITVRTLTTTAPRRATRALLNPQLDEEGKEMLLEITPRAAKRLTEIMTKDANPRLALRIQVESGGCHGFQYLMKLVTLPPSLPTASTATHDAQSGGATEAADRQDNITNNEGKADEPVIREDDTIFAYLPDDASPGTTANLTAPKIILDLPSLELLKGSKVDFTMELIGSQFKIVDNPLATSSCGCGTSFDIKI